MQGPVYVHNPLILKIRRSPEGLYHGMSPVRSPVPFSAGAGAPELREEHSFRSIFLLSLFNLEHIIFFSFSLTGL